MTAASPAAIARAFVTARQQATGLSAYPGAIPPSLADGYAIQAEALALVDAPVGGWKVGRVPVQLVDRFGADRLAGPIFTPTIHAIGPDAAGLVFAEGFGAAEAEFLLRIGQAPDPAQKSFTLNEAAALVDAVHIGLEIASSPFIGINDHGPAVTVSDFGNNNGLLIGAAIVDWQDLAFADVAVSLSIDGVPAGTGRASGFPDGPIGSVRFLLENLAARGIALQPGAWVSTGAVTGVHEVTIGQSVVADFGPLGTATCIIRPQAAA